MLGLQLIPGFKGPFTKPAKHCWLRLRPHNWTIVREQVSITGPQKVSGVATIYQTLVCWTCREVTVKEFKAVVTDPPENKREYIQSPLG